MVKFIITYSFVKLVSYKTFSGSKRQVMAFSANYPFLFSYPYRENVPELSASLPEKPGLGREEPVFSPRRAGISTKRSKHLLRKTVVFFKNE